MADENGEIVKVGSDIRTLLDVELKYQKTVDFDDPRKEPIDLEVVHKLAALFCKQDEIAAFLGISRHTFIRRMADCQEVRDAYESGIERYKSTLRRRMFSIAMSARKDAGNMCIHLSKHVLGMGDKQIITIDDEGNEPGMSGEGTRKAMARLMGDDPRDPDACMEDDGKET